MKHIQELELLKVKMKHFIYNSYCNYTGKSITIVIDDQLAVYRCNRVIINEQSL